MRKLPIFLLVFSVLLAGVSAAPKSPIVPVVGESPSIQDMIQRRSGSQSATEPQNQKYQGTLGADEESLDTTKMSIDFVDADLSEVFRTISAAYGISILADKEVSGKATVHLKDIPVLEGLESLCSANGLEVFREGRILRIRKASEKTINILKMNLQRIDLDVQNRDIKEFIKDFSDKTGLKILAGSDLTGTVTGSWKNVVPLDGFKALMEAHGFRIRQKNGFLIVSGSIKEDMGMQRRRPTAGTMDIEVKDGRVSINLEAADLQEVLRNIAEQAKLNIVFYGEAKEVVNATIANATFDEVFSTILKGSRFTYVLTPEGTLLVGEKGARSALSTSVIHPLRFLKSENALKLIPKSLLDGGLQIMDVKEQNALLVSGAMSEIQSARQFLTLVDVPTLQIALECVIVEFNRGKDFALGLKSTNRRSGADTSGSSSLGGVFASLSAGGIHKTFNGANNSLDVSFVPFALQVELANSEGSNGAQVLARPSISTLNGNKATINVTNTSFARNEVRSADNFVASNWTPYNDGIRLEITPSVTQAGEISIDIAPEITTAGSRVSSDAPPNSSTRTLRTTVNLRDGQTVRLGGLISSSKSKTREGVPFFGSLPWIGWLFSYQTEAETTKELVIYITPRVIPSNGVSTDFRKEYQEMQGRKTMNDMLDEVAPPKGSSRGQSSSSMKPLSSSSSSPAK